jgi:hypothetical protein
MNRWKDRRATVAKCKRCGDEWLGSDHMVFVPSLNGHMCTSCAGREIDKLKAALKFVMEIRPGSKCVEPAAENAAIIHESLSDVVHESLSGRCGETDPVNCLKCIAYVGPRTCPGVKREKAKP